ncbi:NarK family nitrate/nitrite MFS transporter [Chengkuizengella axinellae]|uniref:Nitrate/nitrite transporter n=1 Tax=Chengkuizengella axinellae TaxID=3064388 RepID=A0ABT9J095_9BACL|nr:NarK family nitrate/nitrite MFS transporter [Chengkuizengella sp. 2205SS18-9]MDP5275044.1 NarK family nitrate/nitrite MFS transporter [Chengkuizengella sp. 2205SS18-9]
MSTNTGNPYKGNIRILLLTTFAFFITFVVWFNMAPFVATIKETLNLTDQQVGVLLTMNVALTIPARVIIGMLVDKFGPRKVYSSLMAIMSIPCFMFALGDSFTQLFIARTLLAMIGAGFVIGIRMVSEWFPAKQVGIAEGVYGGWGNFGSAAAAFSLPLIALYVFEQTIGVEEGWRWAIGLTGLVSLIYSFIYFKSVKDTPDGRQFKRPKKSGAMEVSSYGDMIFLMAMTLPMFVILGVLTWKVQGLGLINGTISGLIYGLLTFLFVSNCYKIWSVNKDHLRAGVKEKEKYSFKQVAILDLAYFCTFGSELAVVSMLPLFFLNTFNLSVTQAGMVASSYAFMNLVARPSGGWLSDKFGRKKTLTILVAGLSITYFGLGFVDSSWSIVAVLVLTMTCSFFVQAGEGSVFSMVPLVKKRLTGQVAGMVGAYGNVGATTFLTILTFVSPQAFFVVIGCASLVCFAACFFLKEPDTELIEKQAAEIEEEVIGEKVVA